MSGADFSQRDAVPGISPQFSQRWSPRAFDGSEIDELVLTRIMDAARWSPSCYNEQPWRIHTASGARFNEFIKLLLEGNQGWAHSASVVGFFTARKQFSHNQKPNAYAQFDCGAAWMAMTLQARAEGLYTHAMAGIDHQRAAEFLGLDENEEQVLIAFVIGRRADPNTLTAEQRERERPSSRRSLQEIWQQW